MVDLCIEPFIDLKKEIENSEEIDNDEDNNDIYGGGENVAKLISQHKLSIDKDIEKLIACKNKHLTQEKVAILGADSDNKNDIILLNHQELKVKLVNRYIKIEALENKKKKWTTFKEIDDLVVKTFLNKKFELVIVKFVPTEDLKLLEIKREII